MPCATVHLLVARDTLDRWRSTRHAPFRVDADTTRAFLHGSLGPDVGFIPGIDRFTSELAHYHRPADLCRAILERAQSQTDLGFAWGWIAHVLGDVALHPMVGRAVGEAVHGDRSRRMNAAEDLPAHVGMEVGLDIVLLDRHQDVPRPPRRPHFDQSRAEGLADAFHEVYDVQFQPSRLLSDHRMAVRRIARWPTALGALRRLADGWRSPVLAPLAAMVLTPMRLAGGEGSAMDGFLSPRVPPAWLVDSIERGAESLAEDLVQLARDGLSDVANRNLETGALQHPEDPHPAAVAVRAKLSTGRSQVLSATPGAD